MCPPIGRQIITEAGGGRHFLQIKKLSGNDKGYFRTPLKYHKLCWKFFPLKTFFFQKAGGGTFFAVPNFLEGKKGGRGGGGEWAFFFFSGNNTLTFLTKGDK